MTWATTIRWCCLAAASGLAQTAGRPHRRRQRRAAAGARMKARTARVGLAVDRLRHGRPDPRDAGPRVPRHRLAGTVRHRRADAQAGLPTTPRRTSPPPTSPSCWPGPRSARSSSPPTSASTSTRSCEAVALGVPLFIEKPLATDPVESARVLAAIEAGRRRRRRRLHTALPAAVPDRQAAAAGRSDRRCHNGCHPGLHEPHGAGGDPAQSGPTRPA